MGEFGKVLMIFGGLMLVLGALFTLGGKIPWLGRLPGDIVIQRDNFSFYFPLTTCILLSVVLSIIFALLRR
jgi:formate hydrogenlyase subunit 3/multisubunit Na+/H+ antiporter MnhD subunit